MTTSFLATTTVTGCLCSSDMKRSSSLNRCYCRPHFTSSSRVLKRMSQSTFCHRRKPVIRGLSGNCLRGNSDLLGMLLHRTHLLSLWEGFGIGEGETAANSKRQRLTNPQVVAACRLQGAKKENRCEPWRVASSYRQRS